MASPWNPQVDLAQQRAARRIPTFSAKRQCVKCRAKLHKLEYPALFCDNCLWPGQSNAPRMVVPGGV